MPIASTSDPILDAQKICRELGSQTEEDLYRMMTELGWHEDVVPRSVRVATGVYIELRDGRYYAID